MINVKEAHKLYDVAFTKRGKKFDAQVGDAYKDVENFVSVDEVDKYLDNLVKESIAEGMDEASFSTEDFLIKMNLTEKWNKKREELTEKYDLLFGTDYNSPDRFLDGTVTSICSDILAKNEYISVNRYKHIFTWKLVDDKKQPKFNFLEKIATRRQQSADFKQHLAESKLEWEQQEQEQEETRKMTKFAKILVKELKNDSRKEII